MATSPTQTQDRRRVRDAAPILFLGAWLAGLARSLHPAQFGFGRGFEMAAIAKNLVERGAFANPFEPAITGASAFVPPLYPMLLASWIKIFGWPLPSALIFNIAFNAITAALMPRLSRIFFGDSRPGIAAGCLWIVAMPLMPEWDVSLTICCLVLGCIITGRSIARPGCAYRQGLAAGALGGMISLLNPVALLPFLLWIGFLFRVRPVAKRFAPLYISILFVTLAGCNAPWLVRNYRIWHAFVLRGNFGMTLSASNNDCAVSSLSQNGLTGCYQQTYPIVNDAQLRLMADLGEARYDRRQAAAALAWIRSHPLRFARLTGERIVEFWFPDPEFSRYPVYAIWVITVLSLPGILLMFNRRQQVAWFVLLVWLAYPLIYYIVYSSDRYRYPILWTSLLPAGYFLAHLAPILKTRFLKTSPACSMSSAAPTR